MNGKKRLMDALFDNEHKDHVNLKFFRGTGSDVSTERLCDAAASAMFAVDTGMVDRRSDFGDRDIKQIEVATLVASA